MFAKALDEPQSEYARSVLEDYVITREEYDESQRLYAECVNEGLSAYGADLFQLLPGDDGRYSYELKADEKLADIAENQVMPKCETEDLGGGWIASIYNTQLANPNNESIDALIAECLRDAGLAPDDYSADNAYADRMTDVLRLGGNDQVNGGLATPLDLSTEVPSTA